MKIEKLYNEITSVIDSKKKQSEKESIVIDLVNEYSSENKLSFEGTLECLDSYVNSLK